MINHLIITVLPCILLFSSEIFSLPDSLSQASSKETPDTLLSPAITDTVSPHETALHDSILSDSLSEIALEDTGKDSQILDSIQKIERRDLLMSTNTYFRKIYQKYPETLDSLYNSSIIYPFQIFQADGMNLFEIIHYHPSFTSIPVALASNLNRFLFYGFPAAHVSLHPEYSILDFYTDQTVGLNLFSAAEIKNLHFLSPGNIYYNLQPYQFMKPEMSIFWENGVFKENILNIRFARPLAENFYLGIFSNYQYFRREQFNHRRGGMYSFYRPIYENLGYDSSYVSYKGTNPLTNEHVSSARIAWTAKNGLETRLTYKYADLHNDLATQYFPDSVKDTTSLAWEKRSHYSHNVRAHALALPIGKNFKINTETFLQKNVNRITPVSDAIKDNPLRRGENLLYGGAIKPFYTLRKKDTISIQFSTQRDETIRHNESKWVTHYTQSALSYIYTYSLKAINVNGSANGTIGYTFLKLNGKFEHTPTWNVSLLNTLGNQSLRLYALLDLLPPNIPYDTSFHVHPGYLKDRYQSYGAEGLLRYKIIGLNIGFCYMFDVNDSSVIKAWPNGIPPYNEPRWVFMVTPLFGRWYGLSFSSQWLLSEKKPFIKSKSILSYHLNREGKTLHLFVDIGFDYWSERDSIYYAGIGTWNRPILDLHSKIAVQIKTFRLFYKIDNVFNGNFAYVPGYYMPGLIFRWGFNWLIQG